MKKLSIFLTFLLFSHLCQAQTPANLIFDLKEQPVAAEIEPVGIEKTLNRIITEAQHFDKQYPDNAIYSDFSEDVASRFPELTPQQVYDYESYIRHGLLTYRFFNNIYQKYKDFMIVPQNPPLVLDDKEYDLFSPQTEYIDANDGTVVIEDFKKVISYSSDPKDSRSYMAKLKYNTQQGKDSSAFGEFNFIADNIDWRHIFDYDIYRHSPITGDRGIGAWTGDKQTVRASILTIETGTQDKTSLTGLIHLLVAPGYYIAANGNAEGSKPKIDFANSQNIASVKYILPTPVRLLCSAPWQDCAIYDGEIAIPFKAELEKASAPLHLITNLHLHLCQKDSGCQEVELQPQLSLKDEYSRTSSSSAFIRQIHQLRPRDQLAELKINHISAEEIPGQGQLLKITLTSQEKISYFDIFADAESGIKMQRPRITIDGKEITVRLLPVNPDQKIADENFEITANLNGKYFLRAYKKAELTPAQTPEKKLSWHLLLLAFLGGFILNFMPCVFPVLSLKLFSLTRFGARRLPEVQRNFGYTLLGLFGGFLILATLLSALKYIGLNLGWGMQFQSPIFLVVMILAVILFILQAGGAITIRLPHFRQPQNQPDNFLHFLTGILVVLMATPCTAPYLGTAIGFALAGTVSDIFAIMAAIALGLSFPYILLFAIPSLIILVPHPGPWMQKLNHFMIFMLFLTLGWLLSVLWAQTNFWFIVRLVVYSLLFAWLSWLIHFNTEADDDTLQRSPETIRKTRNILLLLVTIPVFIAVIDGHLAGKRHMQEVMRQTVPSIQKQKVDQYVQEGKTVLVSVGADWCLTCRYNDILIFKNPAFERNIEDKNIELIKVDWTDYDAQTLQFMEQYGRSGLPFYIIFSPLIPEGMILPELLNESDLSKLISNITLPRKPS